MRNQGRDTKLLTFDVNNPYYAEAFGIMRALSLMGFGSITASTPHPDNPKWSLRWWLTEIEQAVLREEGFGDNNECDYCFKRYGKDTTRKETA